MNYSYNSQAFEACVIGPITRDIIRIAGHVQKEMPGGVVYYAAMALQSLGLKTAIVTTAALEDADSLLAELRQAGVHVYLTHSKATTVFENTYPDSTLDIREQLVASVAEPLTTKDLGDIKAPVFYFGPLINRDFESGLLKAPSKRGARVCLDVQGLTRMVTNKAVQPVRWSNERQELTYVDTIKGSLREAQLLSGQEDPERAARRLAELGPREVVITLGRKGSLILAQDKLHRIPAYSTRHSVDATGCGDTYFAGYIFKRLKSDDIEVAGHFAAMLATFKLERFGPFAGTEAEIVRALKMRDPI